MATLFVSVRACFITVHVDKTQSAVVKFYTAVYVRSEWILRVLRCVLRSARNLLELRHLSVGNGCAKSILGTNRNSRCLIEIICNIYRRYTFIYSYSNMTLYPTK